jgi:hypothetical protein
VADPFYCLGRGADLYQMDLLTKRSRRRDKRTAEFGPERRVLNYTPEMVTLECGHAIENPPRQATALMKEPKFYRCSYCKE